MGIFDALNPLSEADWFKEGELFTCTDAKVGNEITTEYGDGTPALLKVRHEDGTEKWYSIFGQALVNQIERQDPGELKQYASRGGRVAIVRKANKAGTQEYKVLATQEQIENDDIPF